MEFNFQLKTQKEKSTHTDTIHSHTRYGIKHFYFSYFFSQSDYLRDYIDIKNESHGFLNISQSELKLYIGLRFFYKNLGLLLWLEDGKILCMLW